MIRQAAQSCLGRAKAAAAEAGVELKIAAAEQRRIGAEIFELKLQHAQGRGRKPDVVGGEPWTVESPGEPRGSKEGAVQSGASAGWDSMTYPGGTTIGLDGRSSPCSGLEASLLQALHVRKLQ